MANPVPVTTVPPVPRKYPSYAEGVDKSVIDAINRLYDKVWQLNDQIQLIAQYLHLNP